MRRGKRRGKKRGRNASEERVRQNSGLENREWNE